MGKLRITGKAERRVPYDVMNITLTFGAAESDSSAAVRKMMKECDEFLGILEKDGMDISGIHLEKSEVSSYTDRNSGKKTFYANRKISFRAAFDMPLINRLNALILENAYDIELDTNFEYSNTNELHAELMKEAVEDSRRKAESIASAAGQKIKGIKEIISGETVLVDEMPNCMELRKYACASVSDRLSAAETTENEEISVVWLIE